MKHKSAIQLQAEIDLMRLAYQERCQQAYRPKASPFARTVAYLLSALITLAALITAIFKLLL